LFSQTRLPLPLPMFYNFLRHLPDQQVSDCKILETIYYEPCDFRLEIVGGWMQVIMPAHTEYKMPEHRQIGRNKTFWNPNLKVKDGPEDLTSWPPLGPSPWALSLVPTNSDNSAWRAGVPPYLHAVAHYGGCSPLAAGDVPWPVLWSCSYQSFQAPQPCTDGSWLGCVYPGVC